MMNSLDVSGTLLIFWLQLQLRAHIQTHQKGVQSHCRLSKRESLLSKCGLLTAHPPGYKILAGDASSNQWYSRILTYHTDISTTCVISCSCYVYGRNVVWRIRGDAGLTHKFLLRLQDELIRFWWSKVRGQCDASWHSREHGILEMPWRNFLVPPQVQVNISSKILIWFEGSKVTVTSRWTIHA